MLRKTDVYQQIQPTIVHLTPPLLTSATLSEKIVCTRPMREGKFNLSVEQKKGKMVIHCYGQGGSGWTTLFGSVAQAISQFISTDPDKQEAIRVIGSGCMGLTAAIELDRLGFKVAGITTRSLYDISSWKAAGYFALVSIKTSPEEQENVNALGLTTFFTYQSIERGEHPYLSKEAVRLLPVYCSQSTESGLENLEVRGIIPPREPVCLDFGNGIIHPGFFKYQTYFLNTTTLMQQLLSEVQRRAIPIHLHEVESFEELSEKTLFNCSGLGAKQLNQDASLVPVRGHFVTLNPTAGCAHLDYMIYTQVEQQGRKEYIYLFPKILSVSPQALQGIPCAGALGGTFITHEDSLSPIEQSELDAQEFQRLLIRSSLFFNGRPFHFS